MLTTVTEPTRKLARMEAYVREIHDVVHAPRQESDMVQPGWNTAGLALIRRLATDHYNNSHETKTSGGGKGLDSVAYFLGCLCKTFARVFPDEMFNLGHAKQAITDAVISLDPTGADSILLDRANAIANRTQFKKLQAELGATMPVNGSLAAFVVACPTYDEAHNAFKMNIVDPQWKKERDDKAEEKAIANSNQGVFTLKDPWGFVKDLSMDARAALENARDNPSPKNCAAVVGTFAGTAGTSRPGDMTPGAALCSDGVTVATKIEDALLLDEKAERIAHKCMGKTKNGEANWTVCLFAAIGQSDLVRELYEFMRENWSKMMEFSSR